MIIPINNETNLETELIQTALFWPADMLQKTNSSLVLIFRARTIEEFSEFNGLYSQGAEAESIWYHLQSDPFFIMTESPVNPQTGESAPMLIGYTKLREQFETDGIIMKAKPIDTPFALEVARALRMPNHGQKSVFPEPAVKSEVQNAIALLQKSIQEVQSL